jgi:magnesium chelatase subunit I
VRTHYPRSIEQEIAIMEGESSRFVPQGFEVSCPKYMKEIIAEITHLARKNPDISKRSGVSVRVSICNYENVVSNALRRAIRLGERQAAPRVSDLPAVLASTMGKIELETVGEANEERLIDRLLQGAVLAVFNRYFLVAEFEDLITQFEKGMGVEASDEMPAMQYVRQVSEVRGLKSAVAKLGNTGGANPPNPAIAASAVEFIMEGLHLNRKLNKDRAAGKTRYRR